MQTARRTTLNEPARYPDRLAIGVPVGFKERARQHAAQEGLTLPDLVRKALERHLSFPVLR